MGYHDKTLIVAWPSPPRTLLDANNKRKERPFAQRLYNLLSPVLGFQLWHCDPCNGSDDGQREDDSCRWFDRGLGEYTYAVKRVLNDSELRAMVKQNTILVNVSNQIMASCVSNLQAIAHALECERYSHAKHRGYWFDSSIAKSRKRREESMSIARDLALNSVDNLLGVTDFKRLVELLAASLNRHFRPWWKHPRWHVHHWQVNFNLPRNLHRALIERCGACGKTLGWNKSCVSDHKHKYHSDCAHGKHRGGSPKQ